MRRLWNKLPLWVQSEVRAWVHLFSDSGMALVRNLGRGFFMGIGAWLAAKMLGILP